MWRLSLIAAAVLALAAPVRAEVYVVHADSTGDFVTIQAAVDAAVDGDVIELTDGTFTGEGNRDIDYLGKAIAIRSQSGDPAFCTIDCGGFPGNPHRGFYFGSGEGEDSVLEGVTIRGGYEEEDPGGAIYVLGEWEVMHTTPVIRNCVLVNNHAPQGGALAGLWWGAPTLWHCRFESNTATKGGALQIGPWTGADINYCEFVWNSAQTGGAVYIDVAAPIFQHCTFIENVCTGTGTSGGAIALPIEGGVHLMYCTVAGNIATGAGGVGAIYASGCHGGREAVGCTFVENTGSLASAIYGSCEDWTISGTIIAFGNGGPAVHLEYGGTASLDCCNIFDNSGGDWVGGIADQLGQDYNISDDPQFCSRHPTADRSWTLQSDSPCAPGVCPCGSMGAWHVGCDDTPTVTSTWGGLKALFRE